MKNEKRKSVDCGFHDSIGAFRRKAGYTYEAFGHQWTESEFPGDSGEERVRYTGLSISAGSDSEKGKGDGE